MDPNANLDEQRRIAQEIVDGMPVREGRAERLAELVLALDEWRKTGGFDPWETTRP